MPGFQMEAWINPTLISPRVKKAAQRMIRSGILNGGYRSASRMLAEQLLKDSSVGITTSANKWGVSMYNVSLTQDTKADIIELLEAARMIEIAKASESNHRYINERYKLAMTVCRRNNSNHLSCHVIPIAQQIATIAAASRTQDQIDAANKLADQLDDVAPIQANIYTPV
jgi:hypothetical protein